MTRRDYILISSVLRKLGNDAAQCFDNEEDRYTIAAAFAYALRAEFPNFDEQRFINAAILPTDKPL